MAERTCWEKRKTSDRADGRESEMDSIYDNERFFNEYAQMSRSREGLAGAGVAPVTKDVSGSEQEEGPGSRLRIWMALQICSGAGGGISPRDRSERKDDFGGGKKERG